MNGFLTKSGTTYHVDLENQLIYGGRLKSPTHYSKCVNFLVNCNPLFYLDNGRVLKTSVIKQYI